VWLDCDYYIFKSKIMTEFEDVVYNNLRMRRDYAESLQTAQALTHYYDNGEAFPRVPYGKEPLWNPVMS